MPSEVSAFFTQLLLYRLKYRYRKNTGKILFPFPYGSFFSRTVDFDLFFLVGRWCVGNEGMYKRLDNSIIQKYDVLSLIVVRTMRPIHAVRRETYKSASNKQIKVLNVVL